MGGFIPIKVQWIDESDPGEPKKQNGIIDEQLAGQQWFGRILMASKWAKTYINRLLLTRANDQCQFQVKTIKNHWRNRREIKLGFEISQIGKLGESMVFWRKLRGDMGWGKDGDCRVIFGVIWRVSLLGWEKGDRDESVRGLSGLGVFETVLRERGN